MNLQEETQDLLQDPDAQGNNCNVYYYVYSLERNLDLDLDHLEDQDLVLLEEMMTEKMIEETMIEEMMTTINHQRDLQEEVSE
jgi:hypothetical protein